MCGGVAPLGESTDEPAHDLGGERTRPWPRLRYVVALVWVVTGLVLFLIEAAGLVLGRG
jgi:hypothetical protein